MKPRVIPFAKCTLITLILCSSGLVAHEANRIVPAEEQTSAEGKNATGPRTSKNLEIAAIGDVGLGGEFPALKNRILRARRVVIKPGGIVAVHEHNRRPGLAYIITGEVYEHRNGKAILRQAGESSFEKTGVIHWWENRSKRDVIAIVVDIVPTKG